MDNSDSVSSILSTRQPYLRPEVRCVPVLFGSNYCTSPQDGGIEDIDYDEW